MLARLRERPHVKSSKQQIMQRLAVPKVVLKWHGGRSEPAALFLFLPSSLPSIPSLPGLIRLFAHSLTCALPLPLFIPLRSPPL